MNRTVNALSTPIKAPAAPVSDGDTPDSVVDALYASLSFEPGGAPDWNRLRKLFLQGAQILPPLEKAAGQLGIIDVEAYIARMKPTMENPAISAAGVHELDAARNVVEFGDLAHVLSSTETVVGPEDSQPVARGINSVQLARAAGRWWIVSFLWDTERPDNPLPPGYLP